MTLQTTEPLAQRKCTACEGGLERYSPERAREQLASLPGWRLNCDGLSDNDFILAAKIDQLPVELKK